MKVSVRGKKGEVNLNQKNFIAKGGEGKIFGVSNVIYKIYDDPAKMIPEAKIDELHVLNKPNILKPLNVVINKKNKVIGFTMNRVRKTLPICKLFTNTFRTAEGITNDIIIELVENTKETTKSIHSFKCLIVDGNELNYLVVNKEFTLPYFIDVNSYQTKSFPPTAIMPSIRDWTSPKFSVLTDWYSFAVIACQLFIGIHPYKGKHPDYKKGDIQNRVMNHVSIFNKKVRIPKTVRDFGLIPKNYLEWFIDVFEKGKRLPPPEVVGKPGEVSQQIIIIKSTDNFDIKQLGEFVDNIIFHRTVSGREITKTATNLYLGIEMFKITSSTDIIYTPVSMTPILVKIEGGYFKLKALRPTNITEPPIECYEKMIVNNTLYLRRKENLYEMSFTEMGSDIFVTTKTVWNIAPNSSQLFNGVIYQSNLGVPYLSIPIPNDSGLSSLINLHIPELSGFRVMDAKYDNDVCVVIGYKNDQYDRFVFRFNKKFKYTCMITEDVENQNVNFVSLESGVVVLISDETMEIFSKDLYSKTIKSVKDPDIDSEMMLCKRGTELRFFKENKLYSIKMK